MAKRVEPQKRGPGGRFVKLAAPAAEPTSTAPGPPTIEYDPPAGVASTAKRTARAGKKPAQRKRKGTAKTRPRTEPGTEPRTEPAPSPAARPLGFRDGLLGPFGLGRRG